MMKLFPSHWLTALALVCAATLAATTSARADSKTYADALNSTPWVLTKVARQASSGTGVLVDSERKLVVTNFHVVGEARNAIIFFPDMKDGKPEVARKHYVDNVRSLGLRGRVVAVDRKRDLALVQLE